MKGSEMYELFPPNFCWTNSFLLKVTCRSGSGWLFPEALLFSLESNAHEVMRVPGCLKDQRDLHQGGTAVCPRRVSCVLFLKKKVTLQKHNVLKVKSFLLYPSGHIAESKQAVNPKSRFKYRHNPPSLGPSRGFQRQLWIYLPQWLCPHWSWDVFAAVLLCRIHTGQLIEGLTCVEQKHFKTSFQIPAANTVHCYHSGKSS